VSQETLVVKLAPSSAGTLKQKLDPARFEFRGVPHALFSAKGEGVVATFYASGKLVVQGGRAAEFLERYVEGGARPAPARTAHAASPGRSGAPAGDPLEQHTLIGSDECGKGDYFGPLVVCAVRLTRAQSDELRGGLVRDSKELSDEACLRLGAALRARYPFAIASLEPERYNEVWARVRNVNHVLADLHAQAVRQLAQPGDHVLVDKFADEALVRTRLADLDIHLTQRVRAEAVLAVAAASIIAREEFLTRLQALSEEVAVDLHKGAGEPVDRAGRRFLALHGPAGLVRVAKLHFKNTQKIGVPR